MIQDASKDIPEGEIAQLVVFQAMLENVDVVKPGERVELIGNYMLRNMTPDGRELTLVIQ